MRVSVSRQSRQALFRVLPVIILLALASCGGKDESPVIPPANFPLSRSFIGFGVINVSYTHIMENPSEDGAASGYARRGSVVSIVERKIIRKGEQSEAWVLADGKDRGWLRENVMDIYDNELKARTAAESMSR